MFEKLKKNILLSISAGALVFLLLSIYADFDEVFNSFLNFNWIYLPFLFSLSFLNYYFRFLKWHYYLRLLNIKISYSESFIIFMSGLTMSLTPGKVGEVLKCYLVKERTGIPMAQTAPVVLAERITDFLSLVFIAIIGAYLFGYGELLVIGTGVFFIAFAIVLGQKQLLLGLIKYLEKFNFFKKYSLKIVDAYASTYELLKIKTLIKMTFLSIPAWLFECFSLYLILYFYGENTSVILSSFIYSFSTIAGSITMLPAGLGVTEGSLTFLMINFGIGKGEAVGATFIVRIVTLWFAIFVGLVFVTIYQKKYGKIKLEDIDKMN